MDTFRMRLRGPSRHPSAWPDLDGRRRVGGLGLTWGPLTGASFRAPLVALALAALLAAPATAQIAEGHVTPQDEVALRKRKEDAIKKGCAWLISQQKPDGSWTYDNTPFTLAPQYYPMAPGVTGLACFALLKCGIRPDDPAIQKGFAFMQSAELKHIYAVSCMLMACEARAAWEPPPEGGEAGKSTERKRPPRPQPGDLALARKCADFIVAHQAPGGLWRYPQNNDEDVSNTQYAMLALDAAQRLGIDVPRQTYEKCASRLIEAQEKDGPEVPAFSVPGAEKSFRELEKVRADMEKAIRALEKRFKKVAPNQPDATGQTLEDATRTVEREASKKIVETAERRPPYKARGWAYIPPGAGNGADWAGTVTGSMTASGLASLFICKFRLEGGDKYERDLRPQIDAACRDAAAWLAKNYSVTKNPGFSIHHYYYLYGLERAGILGVIAKFGDHDWYQEGCEHLLVAQRGDGVWNVPSGTAGPVPDTCFALLFLARGTTPVVEIPQRVATGGAYTDPAQGSTSRDPAQPPAPPR